ncbi:nucleolar pre-rRNA processing protein, putative [Ichthyophthirius multifiliis]|uniref:Nucleolar pre-rRNA processing protein, putative n=1 Tax=Ichthyophthirius multifiliis TaxID=5932 RepID=G0R676_ICHMU|nr:nucleolar pre-rRNA processing protein, putative [Ichthyophthirius multifiliis]EGR27040.1 nucleolar pre-rRNA processing protein, putative [Ichthyophthirius multifiliis]|eukprot:XP_004023924.1 nucleolar pre-rRNA processing protein, putative [Ichthyophthirius multifiliis]
MSKNDNRFDKIKYDPKFQMMSKKDRKVKIDNRFSSMLTDKKFKIVSKTDKYGREIKTDDKINKELQDFYYQSDDDKQNQQKNQKKNLKKQQQQEYDESQQSDQSFQWSKVSSTDSEELEEINEDLTDEPEFHYGIQKENVPLSEQSSSKLALVNYDWMNIKVQDLILLFNSFKGTDGVINRVSLYISDFGKQKLEEENQKGPQNIWKEEKNVSIVQKNEKNKVKKLMFITIM